MILYFLAAFSSLCAPEIEQRQQAILTAMLFTIVMIIYNAKNPQDLID